jgi:hypothetical protein
MSVYWNYREKVLGDLSKLFINGLAHLVSSLSDSAAKATCDSSASSDYCNPYSLGHMDNCLTLLCCEFLVHTFAFLDLGLAGTFAGFNRRLGARLGSGMGLSR